MASLGSLDESFIGTKVSFAKAVQLKRKRRAMVLFIKVIKPYLIELSYLGLVGSKGRYKIYFLLKALLLAILMMRSRKPKFPEITLSAISRASV